MSNYSTNTNVPAVLDTKFDMLSDQTWLEVQQYLELEGRNTLHDMGKVKHVAITTAYCTQAMVAAGMQAEQYLEQSPGQKGRINYLLDRMKIGLGNVIDEAWR